MNAMHVQNGARPLCDGFFPARYISVIWCREESGSLFVGTRQKRLPEAEWTVVRNCHEPLIDEETFLAVQKAGREACG